MVDKHFFVQHIFKYAHSMTNIYLSCISDMYIVHFEFEFLYVQSITSAHHVKDAIITITKMFCVYLYQVNMCKALFCCLSKTANLKSVENPKYFADIIFK